MLFFLHWIFRILNAVMVLAIVVMALGYWLLIRSIPDYSENFQKKGITAPVEIVRNNANIPHIFAKNDDDAFFALGFVHAQDRLWQMTLMRRTAQGRLSEIFGEKTAKIDELIRRYNIYNLARESMAFQDQETKDALEAYTRGVNAWINELSKGGRGRGAPEFFLFSRDIMPWAPADSLSIGKLIALQFSGHIQAEVLRARLSMALPEKRLRDIMPDAPREALVSLPDYSEIAPDILPFSSPNNSQKASLDSLTKTTLSPIVDLAMAGASNAWVASSNRSTSGGSLLANDPHFGFTAPSIWYLARLKMKSTDVIGGTIPGMPPILLGRTEDFGWGLTTSYLDDQDVVLERLNPQNPGEYQTEHGWKLFKKGKTTLKIKGQPAKTLDLLWSEAGPVLPGYYYDLGTVTPEGYVAAISWTALSEKDTSMSAAIRIMKAQNIYQAMTSGRLHVAPSQNLILAGKDGIAHQMIGSMPKRHTDHPTQGRMPSLGSDGKTRWQGQFAYHKNPRTLNPAAGILNNTSHTATNKVFPEHVSYVWSDIKRANRWKKLMETRQSHTQESFMAAQLDTISQTARDILPPIGADLWFTENAAPQGSQDALRQKALRMIAAWNGEMNEHLAEPLIATAWMNALQERLIQDELGELSGEITHVVPIFLERVYHNTDGAAVWCDVVQSTKKETCTEIAKLALDDALVNLSATYGADIRKWRWGNAHEAHHDHSALGQVPVLNWFTNIRHSSSGGDFALKRNRKGNGSGSDAYVNIRGAGYRGVYDFGDPDSSVFIISTGQSGHPLSYYYNDMSKRWQQGEYVQMSLDPDLARAGSVGTTILTPKR